MASEERDRTAYAERQGQQYVWEGIASLANAQLWFLVTIVLALTIVGLLVAWITAIVSLVYMFRATSRIGDGATRLADHYRGMSREP